jgi:hypothetical protein
MNNFPLFASAERGKRGGECMKIGSGFLINLISSKLILTLHSN